MFVLVSSNDVYDSMIYTVSSTSNHPWSLDKSEPVSFRSLYNSINLDDEFGRIPIIDLKRSTPRITHESHDYSLQDSLAFHGTFRRGLTLASTSNCTADELSEIAAQDRAVQLCPQRALTLALAASSSSKTLRCVACNQKPRANLNTWGSFGPYITLLYSDFWISFIRKTWKNKPEPSERKSLRYSIYDCLIMDFGCLCKAMKNHQQVLPLQGLVAMEMCSQGEHRKVFAQVGILAVGGAQPRIGLIDALFYSPCRLNMFECS